MHRNTAKTKCLRGHSLSGTNLVTRKRDGKERRECRTCHRMMAMKRYWRDRAKGIKVPDLHTKEAKKRARLAYREKHRDKMNAKRRARRAANPEKEKAGRLRRSHNMTLQEYELLLQVQNFKCLICGSSHGDWGRKYLVVDHCHTTGRIRGLLCHPCNSMLGHGRDNPEFLRKGAAYLENHMDRP